MSAPESSDLKHLAENAWQDAAIAAKYARAENATLPYASIMIEKSGLAQLEGEASVFDLGCGTGALEAALYKAVPKEKWGAVKVLGGDVSESMLAYLKARAEREGWTGVETQVVDGANINLPPLSFTHLTINFAIFMLPSTVLPTAFTLLRPGGFIAISTWAYFPWYPQVVRAASQVPNPPSMPTHEEVKAKMYLGRSWSDPTYLEGVIKEAGFTGVEVVSKTSRVNCGKPAEYVDTMTMPLGFLALWWEEERREELKKAVSEKLFQIAVEEAGAEDSALWMDFEGIVGTGKKPE